MLILAWDTATAVAGLALARLSGDGPPEILAERFSEARAGHSEWLPPMVGEVLAEAGIAAGDLSMVACGRGPGSFTGLRVGLALAKGLAMGAGVPAVGVGTLDTLAAGAGLAEGALVAPLIDARRQEVFTALFRLRAQGLPPARLGDVVAVRPERLGEFLDTLGPHGGPLTLVGPGLALIEAPPGVILGDPGPPKAAVLAELAAALAPFPVAERALDPIYGRPPEIFRTWTPPARLAPGAG